MLLASIGFIRAGECLIAADQSLEHEAVIDVRRGSLDLADQGPALVHPDMAVSEEFALERVAATS